MKWYQLSKDKLKQLGENQEVKDAFKALEKAIRDADLDKRWDIVEIFCVIMAAYNLFRVIKLHMEE